MDIRKVKKLIELLDDSGIAEIEITEGEESVRISRYAASAPVAAAPIMAHAPAPAAPSTAPAAEAPAAAPAEVVDEDGFEVTAPMVGTYYSAPNPDSDQFVNVGDSVGPDTVVCLVEAMKIFNEIKAECSGTIEKILVNNSDAIEFGQALFLVRPN